MELKPITRESADKAALQAINEEAIPEQERCSMDELFDTGADGNLEVLGIYVSGEPVGFLAVRKYKRVRYLAYFAVRADLRSQGIGSAAIQELFRQHPECQTIVEYESPDFDDADRDLRLRRKHFYLRNGFYETGWNTCYDGMEFEIGCSDPVFRDEEFAEFVAYLKTFITDHLPNPYPKRKS